MITSDEIVLFEEQCPDIQDIVDSPTNALIVKDVIKSGCPVNAIKSALEFSLIGRAMLAKHNSGMRHLCSNYLKILEKEGVFSYLQALESGPALYNTAS